MRAHLYRLAAEPAKPEPHVMAVDTPLLRIEAVVKTFGTVRAVDGLSLDIGAGEFFALLGPSGCGKTTLLRMLAGFETPDQGRILLGGEDIAKMLPHQRPVNMMFQNYALFPHLNVRDNIAFGLRRAGLPRAEIRTGSPRWWHSSSWKDSRSESPTNSPAARGSAWRWRARWRAARWCCCSTSRSPRSTRSCAKARKQN